MVLFDVKGQTGRPGNMTVLDGSKNWRARVANSFLFFEVVTKMLTKFE